MAKNMRPVRQLVRRVTKTTNHSSKSMASGGGRGTGIQPSLPTYASFFGQGASLRSLGRDPLDMSGRQTVTGPLQCFVQVVNQGLAIERLGQETDRSGRQC